MIDNRTPTEDLWQLDACVFLFARKENNDIYIRLKEVPEHVIEGGQRDINAFVRSGREEADAHIELNMDQWNVLKRVVTKDKHLKGRIFNLGDDTTIAFDQQRNIELKQNVLYNGEWDFHKLYIGVSGLWVIRDLLQKSIHERTYIQLLKTGSNSLKFMHEVVYVFERSFK